MQQQAIEFLAWLGMTYAGTFVVLTVMEPITKRRKKNTCRGGCKCSKYEK